MTRTRTAVLLAASALSVALLSACGTGHGSSSKAAAPANTQSTAVAGQNASQNADQGTPVRLAAKQIDKLGTVITDGKGMTLYRFDKDTAKPSASNCDGQCATLWPPLTTTTATVQLSGIDKDLIGTVARKDGSLQVTIAGWPLYRYAKDTAPGDAKGQGVGGTWFAATPQGKKATASGGDSGNNSGGYGY
jgi:predicted lipoprotein with Yx(FWY)xxD motif